jgi:hypothetical protein
MCYALRVYVKCATSAVLSLLLICLLGLFTLWSSRLTLCSSQTSINVYHTICHHIQMLLHLETEAIHSLKHQSTPHSVTSKSFYPCIWTPSIHPQQISITLQGISSEKVILFLVVTIRTLKLIWYRIHIWRTFNMHIFITRYLFTQFIFMTIFKCNMSFTGYLPLFHTWLCFHLRESNVLSKSCFLLICRVKYEI